MTTPDEQSWAENHTLLSDSDFSNDVNSETGLWSETLDVTRFSNASKRQRWKWCSIAAIPLAISIGLNVVLMLRQIGLESSSRLSSVNSYGRSQYSGLPRNVSKELKYHSPYWGKNETTARNLWNQLEIHTGFVALDKGWTDEKDLPRGDSFPWDDSKSIYVLNAFHILHCLQMLRISVVESHHNRPQSMSYKHLQHCLNDMREDAMCNADDTPRYTHPWPDRVTGADGQLRQCRDFEALSSWARANTACFSFSHRDDPSWNKTARFRHCPPDSPYLPAIRKTYGFADDWLPDLNISPSWSHGAEN